MNKTNISYVSHTWNPITGCSPCSPGCINCYAKQMAQRLRGRCGYPQDDPFKVTFHPERLNEPSKIKKPTPILTCSMGDMFHEDVQEDDISKIFYQMAWNAPWHTYLVLTKRVWRMKEYVARWSITENIWLGCTICYQQEADEKIPILLSIPAAHRWISIEPILSEINLDAFICGNDECRKYFTRNQSTKALSICCPYCHHVDEYVDDKHIQILNRIDWVVVGSETGPGARPCDPDWIRSIRDQCKDTNVPLFVKQVGRQIPDDLNIKEYPTWR